MGEDPCSAQASQVPCWRVRPSGVKTSEAWNKIEEYEL